MDKQAEALAKAMGLSLCPCCGKAKRPKSDSRALAAADCCVASPPYAASDTRPTHLGCGKGTRADGDSAGRNKGDYLYPATPANLGNLPPGGLADALVASPPYAGNEKSDYLLSEDGKTRRRDTKRGYKQGHGCFRGSETYGQTEGQLGAMETGAVDGVVSSPPFCDSDGRKGGSDLYREKCAQTGRSLTSPSTQAFVVTDPYGSAPGQLANDKPDTFWAASRTILAHVFALLKPGGVAVWVVKAYCREGQIVDFPGDWRRLCESLGFVTLHEHHALLVEEHGTQGGLFGEDTVHQTHRKSFFRRLHEKKRPDLAINHETIYCMQKPAHGPGNGLQAVISSPPYMHSVHEGNGIDPTKLTGNRPGPHTQAGAEGYGTTPGQLGSMPAGPTP